MSRPYPWALLVGSINAEGQAHTHSRLPPRHVHRGVSPRLAVARESPTLSASPTASADVPNAQTELVRWSSYYFDRRQRGDCNASPSSPARVNSSRGDAHRPADKEATRPPTTTTTAATTSASHERGERVNRHVEPEEAERRRKKKTKSRRHKSASSPTRPSTHAATNSREGVADRDSRATRRVIDAFHLTVTEERLVLAEFMAHTRRRWSNPQKQWLDVEAVFRKLNGKKRASAAASVHTDPNAAVPPPSTYDGLRTVEAVRRAMIALCARGVLVCDTDTIEDDPPARLTSPLSETAVNVVIARYRLAQAGLDAILALSATHSSSQPPSLVSLSWDKLKSLSQEDDSQGGLSRGNSGGVWTRRAPTHTSRPTRDGGTGDAWATLEVESIATAATATPRSTVSSTASAPHTPTPVLVVPAWTERQLETVLWLLQENARKRLARPGLSVMQLWSYLQLPQVREGLPEGLRDQAAGGPAFGNRKELYLALNILIDQGRVCVLEPSPYPAESKYGLVV